MQSINPRGEHPTARHAAYKRAAAGKSDSGTNGIDSTPSNSLRTRIRSGAAAISSISTGSVVHTASPSSIRASSWRSTALPVARSRSTQTEVSTSITRIPSGNPRWGPHRRFERLVWRGSLTSSSGGRQGGLVPAEPPRVWTSSHIDASLLQPADHRSRCSCASCSYTNDTPIALMPNATSPGARSGGPCQTAAADRRRFRPAVTPSARQSAPSARPRRGWL